MRVTTLAAALLAFAGPAASAVHGRVDPTPMPRVLTADDGTKPPEPLNDGTKPPKPLNDGSKPPKPLNDGTKPPEPLNDRSHTLSCGAATLDEGTYTITSTNHPNNYGNNEDCQYSLTTQQAGNIISLTCQAFAVEANSNCAYDWLKVQGQKFCGTSGPSGVTSQSTMTIEWHSDYSVVRSGYSCMVRVSRPSSLLSCGAATLSPGTFTITSTNHPNNYGNNEDCEYSLTTEQAGDMISLTCQAFAVEANSNCAYDWLKVQGQKYCGTTGPSGVTSQSTMTIEWHSDYSVVRGGYSCTVEVSSPPALSCGTATLSRGTFTITSTNHPNNYGNNEDCEYSLTTEQAGDTISLTCQAFAVEANSNCAYDWLKVQGQKYCGTSGPSGVTSQSAMTIEWHSDQSIVESGYSCTVEVSASTVPPTPGPVLTSCCCGLPNRAARIVGGVETEVNEYPWQAGLRLTNNEGTYWCGGTVINSKYVLTAAHCTEGMAATGIQVLLGAHNRNDPNSMVQKSVVRIIDHLQYTSPSESGYDFSLLELTEPIDFPSDNTIAPACLPTDTSETYVGVDAIVSGWGATSFNGTSPSNLREVTVPVISNTVCFQKYGGSINPSMMCAGLDEGGKDSCQGDSGGPLVTLETDRYTLIGVVSWGNRCAEPNYPGVYGRVTEILDWIITNAAGGEYCS